MKSDRMRILHLQTDDGLNGGIANYISNLLKSDALSRQNNFVVVPDLNAHRGASEAMYSCATTIGLPRSYNAYTASEYYNRLVHIVKSLNIDIIHAHALRCALPASLASAQLRIPLVYTNHGLRYAQKARRMDRHLFLAAERFVTQRASAIVAIRPYDLERMKLDASAPSDRSYLVQTRLNEPPSERRLIQGHRPMLLGVGSLISVKRPLLFLQWVAALQAKGIEFDAVWAGDGPLRGEMTAAAASLQVPVTFPGNQSRQEMENLYSKADLLLLSSEFETFSIAVLEAMAHGVPTVTSTFPGVGDIVSNGVTGIVVDEPIAESVANAIEKLLYNHNFINRLSKNCISIYINKYYNIDIMGYSYSAIYDSIKSHNGGTHD
jgi:glycosyltransferase involved in cell wall biosynthesis